MKPFDFTAVPLPLPSHKFRKRQTNFCYCSTNIRFMQVKKHAKENHLENPRYMWTVGESGQRRTGTTAFPEGCSEISGNVPLTAPLLSKLIEKIIIHETEEASRNRTQRIEICYPFVDHLDIPESPKIPTYHGHIRQCVEQAFYAA